jgi:hypothetical protein
MGLMQGQANTDAVNRASRLSYGEATGITQTVRNYGASLGFAVLGTLLVSGLRSNLTSSLVANGLAPSQAAIEASRIAEHQGGTAGTAAIPHFVRLDFAYASQTVFYVMAGIMVVAAVVAKLGLRPGRQQDPAGDRVAEGHQAFSADGQIDLVPPVAPSGAGYRHAPFEADVAAPYSRSERTAAPLEET